MAITYTKVETPIEEIPSYKNRYIAFLDILGFSNYVDDTLIDKKYFNRLVKVTKILQRHMRLTDLANRNNVRTYMFSDSICLTYDPTQGDLVDLIDGVSELCALLMCSGVSVRGAVVLGQVFEEENIIFGPGLIDAYKKESAAANYPRVLVSNDIYEVSQAIKYAVGGWSEPQCLADRIRRDFDGLYHVNWLIDIHNIVGPSPKKGIPTHLPIDYERIKSVVQHWLNEEKERIDIQSKWQWFANYFNEVILLGKERNTLGRHSSISTIEY